MKTYSVSYDLSNPGRDYDAVIDKIKELANGWCHPLESTWLINSSLSAGELSNEIASAMDSNDKLIIYDVGDNWATRGMSTDINEWLRGNWHSACAV